MTLGPGAAGLGGANPAREAPGSVAAAGRAGGRGETKQLQPLLPARPPSLPAPSPSPGGTPRHDCYKLGEISPPHTPPQTPQKSQGGAEGLPPKKGRGQKAKSETTWRRASGLLCPPSSSSFSSPGSPAAYLAQEVDIVEGGQKGGRHGSGSWEGPSCRRGGPEEPSARRGRPGAAAG